MYVCICLAHRGQKGVSDPQELALKKVVSCHVDARNWTQALWRAASAVNYWLISSAHQILSLFCHIMYIVFEYLTNIWGFDIQ